MFVHQSITSIEPLGPSPSFWSLEFYLRYFTKCLGRNLKNHPDCRQDHIFFEISIAMGLPPALDHLSAGELVVVFLGVAVVIALILYYVQSRSDGTSPM